jgi:hypothetical protein
MPSDTYILTISDAGVSVPSPHASSHLTGGSDAIPVASTSTSGLMSPAIFDQHVINTAKVSNATHTGDVTDASGVLTVSKINGVSMAGLATGILKNTTGTGVPSIAVAADFPPLNQNTLGNASTATLATTATNIAGGSAGFVPYQTGSGTTSLLNAGTAGYVLTANGSAAPSWGPVTLSSGTSGTLLVASGGTGAATFTAGILKGNGTSAFTTVTAPTGDVVGTSDTQTLTNKTMGSGTTFSSAIGVSSGGTGQTTFTAGVLKADGTTGFTTVTAPTGAIVGTSDTQTLTNKTLTSPTLTTPVLGTPSSGTLTSCTGLPLTTGVTGTLLATNGGTGQSSYAVGDLLYASTTTSVAKLADVATGSVLLSGGIDTAPAYGKVGLTTHVTGTLPVSNGGTGLATITGYVKGTGTSPLSTSATIPVADISGILPVANGGTGYGSDGIGTLSFDTTPDTGTALTEGQLRWNATDKTLDLKMTGANVTQQIGEELLMRVHAAEEISNGNIVYISGQNSGLPAVLKASANNINSRKTLAVATEDIASGSDGYVTLYGLVRGLDLSAYTAGQELWLANSGLFTGTEAAHPDYKVRIGFVIVAADGTGVMYSSPKFYENGTVNGTGKIGYLTGSGGTVTQATSKTTGVTLHKTNGQITMHNASLSGYAAVSFTLTNSTIDAGDVLVLNHIGGGTLGTYAMNARSAADSATISLSNLNNGSLSEAVVIAFAVIKAVTA